MIKANFTAYGSYMTDSLYQWDLNQVLIVTGLNLSTIPEVHFDNGDMDRAIVRRATVTNGNISVTIPNSLLQIPITIYAHIGIYEGETFKIIETVEIPVIPKEKPFDYKLENDDEEIYSFNKLETKIDNVLEDLKNNVSQFTPKVNVIETDTGYILNITDMEGTRSVTIASKGVEETVTEKTTTIAQNAQFSAVDYTPVYDKSHIVIEAVDCHYLEGTDYVGIPVAFSVLPKYENNKKVNSVKSITAMRIGSSTAKVNITLKIHEVKCI